jgi:hypothetical protein
MYRLFKKFFAFAGVLSLSLTFTNAQLSTNGLATIRVLFVGNSYTYADDIPWITKQLASSAGESKTLDVEMIAPLGATLQSHWEIGEVTRRLHEGKWDYVVLQEQSTRPIEQPETTQEYARLLDSEIKKVGAKTVLFVTWPRQKQPENFVALTNTYLSTAQDLKAIVAPIGIAWMSILKENPSLPIYHRDGSHPNPIGSYLSSCVLYSLIFGKSPVGLSRTLYSVRNDGSHPKVGELTEADALIVQRAAWQSVTNTLQTKL